MAIAAGSEGDWVKFHPDGSVKATVTKVSTTPPLYREKSKGDRRRKVLKI